MVQSRVVIVLLSLLVILSLREVSGEGGVKSDTGAFTAADDTTVTSDDFSQSSSVDESEQSGGPVKASYGHGGHYDGKYDNHHNYHDHDYNYNYKKGSNKYKKDYYNKDDYKKNDKKNDYKKNDKKDHYEKYDNYGKDDKHNTHDDKYYNNYAADDYKKCNKEKSFECIAYIGGVVSSTGIAQLFQSIEGQQATLASTYTEPNGIYTGLFSNRARGAYCEFDDIEMMVSTTGNSFVSKFEATSVKGVSRLYTHDTGLVADKTNGYIGFVTRILLKRMYKIIDAYFYEFEFGFAQYDVNALTNKKVAISFPQSICYDTAFFKNDESRFVCQGQYGGTMTTYSRDPETGVNFVPPETNNPYVVGYGKSYTSVRLCKKNYISSIGYSGGDGLIITRAKYSLKYPYFKDIEEIYSEGGADDKFQYIYTPAHTDTIYACNGKEFYRFDNAYTDEAPLTPAVQTTMGDQCRKIISFNKCPLQVYVVDENSLLFYSPDGGVTWSNVNFLLNTFVDSLTGFSLPVKDYY